MGMVIAGISILGPLAVIVVFAWQSVFRSARGGGPLCPRCRSPMYLITSLADAHLTLRCKRCDRGDPPWYGKARAWAKSRLHPPQ